jgi:hypothetical protein
LRKLPDGRKTDFLQPKAPRIPEPTNLTNVIATLKGSDRSRTDLRRFRALRFDVYASPTDAKCDAPGANDDASGTAAVIELARVMSKRKFDATIVFMAVAGEEQGLLGARYFAEQAVEKKMNIEAMFTNDIIGGVTTHKNSPEPKFRPRFHGRRSVERNRTEGNTRRSVGGENDSRRGSSPITSRKSRPLIRRNSASDDLPARPLRARRRSYSVSRKRFPAIPHYRSRTKITTHQHQNVARRTACFTATRPNSSILNIRRTSRA